jgi:hypothetical protein
MTAEVRTTASIGVEQRLRIKTSYTTVKINHMPLAGWAPYP